MLAQQETIIDQYVLSGQVQLVFWPVLNHGNPSVYATVTMQCVGLQDPEQAWDIHHDLFENQSQLWNADRDYYVQAAVAVGADQVQFETCYDGAAALDIVRNLDDLRVQRGVYGQPYFDVNGILLAGTAQLEGTIAAQLP